MSAAASYTAPEGWRVAGLGEVCKTTSGGTPSRRNDAYFEGDIPWVKSGELPDGMVHDIQERITQKAIDNSSAKLFPAGTLLIALYGATIGKLGVLPRAAATNQAICAIFPEDDLDQKYLFWFLRYARSHLLDQAIGGAQPNISQGILRDLQIPIAPIEDQRRIVAEIEKQFSRLDEAVASLKRVKANLKRCKAAVLKAAVEGKLTEEWRKQNPNVEPSTKLLERLSVARELWIDEQIAAGSSEAKRLRAKLKKHSFDAPVDVDLPGRWSWSSLLMTSLVVVDCHNKTAPYEGSGIPLVRTTNIRDGRVILETAKYISEETYEYWSKRCPPEPGDILFTREAPMGEAAVIPDGVKLCMGQRMMLIRLPHEIVDNLYVLSWLRSPSFQYRLGDGAVGMGVKHLRVGDVEKLIIPIPPLAEQRVIANIVAEKMSLFEALEVQIEKHLLRSERLRTSILDQAFSAGIKY